MVGQSNLTVIPKATCWAIGILAIAGTATAEQAAWSGGYAAIQFGASTSDLTGIQDCCGVDAGDDPNNLNPTGLHFGFRVGLDRQHDDVVFGVLGDGAILGASDTQFSLSEPIPNKSRHEINGLVTLRGRVGYVFDDTLLYGTAGIGYASTRYTMEDPDGADASGSKNLFGYGPVIGLGVQFDMEDGRGFIAELLHFSPNGQAGTSDLTTDSNPQDFIELGDTTLVNLGFVFRF